jgi:4-diphosphocytidyl-2-C-methyl-D-erythritol kinase
MSKKPNSAASVIAAAPAKVNLGLHVLGKRPDGYHNLVSLMVPVSLCDELRFELNPRKIELHCPNSDLPTTEENLVYQAARLALDECARVGGVTIELRKNIPEGAGLGGGSSDAAATLLAVNQLLGSPMEDGDLYRLAAKLGADVPFFLLGRWAVAQGTGDLLTPVENVPILWTVLLYPNFQVSTRWAYENLTLTSRANGSKFNTLGDTYGGRLTASYQKLLDRQGLALKDLFALLVNDFEPLVFGHYPQLHDLKISLLAAGAQAVSMTGSGPTLVGLFRSEQEARAAHYLLRRKGDITTLVAHTLDTTTQGRIGDFRFQIVD